MRPEMSVIGHKITSQLCSLAIKMDVVGVPEADWKEAIAGWKRNQK